MAKTSSSAKEAPSSTNAPKTPVLGQGPSACTNPKPQRCANPVVGASLGFWASDSQTPQAQPEPQLEGVVPPESQVSKPTLDLPRSRAVTRPVTPAAAAAVARKTPPKSHQSPIQVRTTAPAQNPPRNPPLGNRQTAQAHMLP